jgi:hypothetical protein
MTSKTVELAIFWLPLVASVLLGGIAGSAWYGGDKIPAIWIAFFGAACFLLTITLQFQQYAYANLLQPEIDIVVPSERSIITWDPPESFFINARSENKDAPSIPNNTSPVIIFENKSGTLGQDASITWSLARFDMKILAESAPRLKPYDVSVDSQSITIGARQPITGPAGLGMKIPLNFRQNVPPIAFLGKRVESWIPTEVWIQALLFFLATLPDDPGARSPPLIFDVVVKWNIPENSKPAKFQVKAIAINGNVASVAKPALTAYVELQVVKP